MATSVEINNQAAKMPRTIRGYPLVGLMPDYHKNRLSVLQRLAFEGDVCSTRLGPFSCMLFNKPEHVRSILVEHAYAFDKGIIIQNILRPVLGNGIFCSEGNFHRSQRKIMAPPFQPRHIAGYADMMVSYGEQIQQTWTDGAVIDINQQMINLTMNIIGKALFDAEIFSEADELGAAMNTVADYITHVSTSSLPLPYSWPTPRSRRTHKAMQTVRDCFKRFINERRSNPIERNDILSILLQARDEDGQPMSDEQAIDECLILFLGGHESTSTALSWTWYLLCQHPECYQQVQEEVDRVLRGRVPTAADLAHLPYCLQVFKEAMRLYPPGYVTVRQALHDIEIDGYRVAKGQIILLASYTLHRREEFFPEPELFDPTRFTPEREKQLPRYAYLPFGAGPRICIGTHFALMEGQLLLATLAQRVSFALVPEQTIEPDPDHHLTLRSAGALYVTVKMR